MKCTPDNTQCPLHKELAASDARYQLRIKELEEALQQISGLRDVDGNSAECDCHEDCQDVAKKALSTT